MIENWTTEQILDCVYFWNWTDDLLEISRLPGPLQVYDPQRIYTGTGQTYSHPYHQTHYIPPELSGLKYRTDDLHCGYKGDSLVVIEVNGQDMLVCPMCGGAEKL